MIFGSTSQHSDHAARSYERSLPFEGSPAPADLRSSTAGFAHLETSAPELCMQRALLISQTPLRSCAADCAHRAPMRNSAGGCVLISAIPRQTALISGSAASCARLRDWQHTPLTCDRVRPLRDQTTQKAWQEASRGFEPRSLDSESRVLTVTPRGQVMILEVRAVTADSTKKREAISMRPYATCKVARRARLTPMPPASAQSAMRDRSSSAAPWCVDAVQTAPGEKSTAAHRGLG